MSEEENKIKAGDAWRNYIKQYPGFEKAWIAIPEPTNTWMAQQIDIFAGKYPTPAQPVPVKPVGDGMRWVKASERLPENAGVDYEVEGNPLPKMTEPIISEDDLQAALKTIKEENQAVEVETITGVEEAAERRYGKDYNNKQCMQIACFKAGAEWQAKQSKSAT